MDIYEGSKLVNEMRSGDKATCVIGSYRDYTIEMNEHGDIVYPNGKIVALDRYFINGKWNLQKQG